MVLGLIFMAGMWIGVIHGNGVSVFPSAETDLCASVIMWSKELPTSEVAIGSALLALRIYGGWFRFLL
ncbi:hypothetical protein EV2_043341 [Malus domestica]